MTTEPPARPFDVSPAVASHADSTGSAAPVAQRAERAGGVLVSRETIDAVIRGIRASVTEPPVHPFAYSQARGKVLALSALFLIEWTEASRLLDLIDDQQRKANA